MKNFTAILLTAILVATTLTACGGSTPTPSASGSTAAVPSESTASSEPTAESVTITFGFWGDSGEDKAYAAAIANAEAAVPGVTVELAQFPSTQEFWANLPGQIAAGTAPDFIAPTNEGHMSYIVEGLFLPLDSYNMDTSDVLPSALDAWSYNGSLYAFPTTAAPGIFVVNMDLWNAAGLGELPKTWDEVYKAAKILTAGDVKGICMNVSQNYHTTQYANSFGGGWGNGTTINSAENVAALDYIINMFKEGLAVQAKDLGLSWDGEVFAGGKAAMTTAGAWYNGFMAESAPDINFEVIAMPGGNGQNGCSLHTTGFAILNTSKNPEVAAQVAMHMARPDAQKEMANTAGYQPSLISLQDWYYTEYKDGPKMASTRASLDTAVSFGYPIQSVEFETDLVRALDEIIYNGAATTSQEILDTLASKYGA